MKNYSLIKDLKKFLSLERIKSLLVIIPAFLVFLSFIYLFTYYSFFDVNIFNYISLNTIGLYAIKTITGAIIATILIFISQTKYFQIILIKIQKRELFQDKSSIGYLTFGVFLALPSLILVHISYRLIFNQQFHELFDLGIYTNVYWLLTYLFGLFLFGSIGLTIYAITQEESKRWINGINILYTSIIITLFYSVIEANEVSYNYKYKYIEGQNLIGNYTDQRYKLIGKSDDYYFLQPLDKETVIIKKYDDFERLHLKTFKAE